MPGMVGEMDFHLLVTFVPCLLSRNLEECAGVSGSDGLESSLAWALSFASAALANRTLDPG